MKHSLKHKLGFWLLKDLPICTVDISNAVINRITPDKAPISIDCQNPFVQVKISDSRMITGDFK